MSTLPYKRSLNRHLLKVVVYVRPIMNSMNFSVPSVSPLVALKISVIEFQK